MRMAPPYSVATEPLNRQVYAKAMETWDNFTHSVKNW